MRSFSVFLVSSVLAASALSGGARAQMSVPAPVFEGDFKFQTVLEENGDFGTDTDRLTDGESLDARLRATWSPIQALTFMGEVRGVRSYGGSGNADDEVGTVSAPDAFLELRQLWVRLDRCLPSPNWNVQLGRQRLKEDRNFWWNRDLDAARLNFDYTLTKGFVALSQDLTGYQSGWQDFVAADEGRARLLGQIETQWVPGHFLGAFFATEQDHSDQEAIGRTIALIERDDEDQKLTWAGLRLRGGGSGAASPLGYALDLAGMSGEIDDVLTTAGADAGTRLVTGHTTLDARGWALDAQASWTPGGVDPRLAPTVLLGYAFGSGDDDSTDGTDHAFRQTGLQANSGRLADGRTSFRRYGEAFDPELSNIHILSAGLSWPVFAASDINLMYHYYRLAEAQGALRSAGVSAALDGVHRDLGHAVDAAFTVHLGEELGWAPGPLESTSLRFSAGAFRGGAAYGAAEAEIAARGLLELRLSF